MIDLKLDENGDLDVSSADLHFVTDGEQVVQRCQIRLRTFFGEVPLNTQAGVTWFEDILGVKPIDLNRAEAVLRDQILKDAEIESIESFAMDYENATRKMTLNFSVISIYGPLAVTVQSPEGV